MQELGRLPRRQLVAGTPKRDRDGRADAAWMRQQADDAVAEVESFLKVVRDEQHRGAGVGDDRQDLVLERLRVMASRAPKGSSISNTFGSWARQRAICSRCCMPPDSSAG